MKNFGKHDPLIYDEDSLKGVLLNYGPVTTMFRIGESDATGAFMSLAGKMNFACNAEVDGLGHVMTIIGWDKDYFIMKNSYGDKKYFEAESGRWLDPWGENGYLYLRKELALSCGVFGPGSIWYFPDME